MKASDVKGGVGLAAKRKFTEDQADPDELTKGIKDEMAEHGMDRATAKRTALDHLATRARYYSDLERFEAQQEETKK